MKIINYFFVLGLLICYSCGNKVENPQQHEGFFVIYVDDKCVDTLNIKYFLSNEKCYITEKHCIAPIDSIGPLCEFYVIDTDTLNNSYCNKTPFFERDGDYTSNLFFLEKKSFYIKDKVFNVYKVFRYNKNYIDNGYIFWTNEFGVIFMNFQTTYYKLQVMDELDNEKTLNELELKILSDSSFWSYDIDKITWRLKIFEKSENLKRTPYL